MISAVMISCEHRQSIRRQTIENLYSTDWEWKVDIILDKDYIGSKLYEDTPKTQRQTIASYHALKVAIAKNNPWVIFMEDDLIYNKHIAHNIINWEPISNYSLNFGSLYTPNGNRCSLEEGEYWYKADCLRLYGSQCYIMSIDAAQWIVDHWENEIGMQDIKMTRLSRGKPIFYHSPSLVQHRDTPSVWGGISHQAHDFDEHWKHP